MPMSFFVAKSWVVKFFFKVVISTIFIFFVLSIFWMKFQAKCSSVMSEQQVMATIKGEEMYVVQNGKIMSKNRNNSCILR